MSLIEEELHDGDAYGGRFVTSRAMSEGGKKLQRLTFFLNAVGSLREALQTAVYAQQLDQLTPELMDKISRKMAHVIAARRVMYQAGDLSAAVISGYADKICAELVALMPHQDVPVRSSEESHDH